MSLDLVSRLFIIYRNVYDIKNKSFVFSRVFFFFVLQGIFERKDSLGFVFLNIFSQEEGDQICLYYIWKSCSF